MRERTYGDQKPQQGTPGVFSLYHTQPHPAQRTAGMGQGEMGEKKRAGAGAQRACTLHVCAAPLAKQLREGRLGSSKQRRPPASITNGARHVHASAPRAPLGLVARWLSLASATTTRAPASPGNGALATPRARSPPADGGGRAATARRRRAGSAPRRSSASSRGCARRCRRRRRPCPCPPSSRCP